LSSEYKHISEPSNRFKKSFKSLDKEMKQRTIEKLEELLKGQISGEPLKGEYKGFKRIRIGKHRLIYSDAEPCKIYLYDIRPRETAYI
jgi:mRNA-degrading endonuclease RelE of RelBE toxin-antitoxin system